MLAVDAFDARGSTITGFHAHPVPRTPAHAVDGETTMLTIATLTIAACMAVPSEAVPAEATHFAAATPPAAKSAAFELIGTASIPGDALDRSGLAGEVVAGVPHARLGSVGSGIDCIERFAGGVRLIGTCDRGPADGAAAFQCRLQSLTLRVDPAASPTVAVQLDASTLLRRPDGVPFTGLSAELGTQTDRGGTILGNRLDPEGVRRLPSGNFLLGEEYMPGVLEFAPDGKYVRTWPVPDHFACKHPGKDEAAEVPPANTSGRQPNKGFEGLAITPSGEAWVLLQNPLIQDGALNAKGKRVGRNIRLLCLGREPGAKTMREVVYRLDDPAYGTSELMALDDHRFLVIERDGSAAKFRRIYEIDTTGSTDVSGIASLPGGDLPGNMKPVAKRLLIDLADPATGIGQTPEKIEGLCWGPTLADGRRTLVVATDNDMKADQPSVFWVFALPSSADTAAR
jgi:hypothetical protein